MDVKEILNGFKHAKSDRAVTESSWSDIYYYVNPYKRDVYQDTVKGEKIPAEVYDNTAIHSNIVMAAGFAGFLTNASQRWFELRPRDRHLMDASDEKIWFEDVTNIMFDTFNDSNFYQQMHEVYLDFGPAGNGILYSEEDPKTHVRFNARDPKEVYFIENARGEVDTVWRCFEMTAYQAYNFFGKDSVSESVRKCVEEENNYTKKSEYIHFVGPRSKRDVSKIDDKNKPYMSIWVDKKEEKKLREGGYDEFPFAVTRFYKKAGEQYGYGPGSASYKEIRMLNQMVKTYFESAEIALFPPSLAEHDSILGKIDYRARAINYQRQPLYRGKAIEPMLNGANFQIGLDFVQWVADKVEKAFFNDLFQALQQTKRMTATEVMEISQERMFLLGPVLGRLQNELLTPVISRTFNILLRRGVLPSPPPTLQNITYDVVYTSPLARAQRAMQSRDANAFMAAIGQMAQMIPTVLDNINSDELVRDLHEMYSVTTKAIRGGDEVEELRQRREEEQRAIQQQQAMIAMAGMAKDAGSATKQIAEAQNVGRQS